MRDERLELTLFAADPDIVTPIGIAVDSRDRVYVLESHTHLPPSDYPGPTGDRIKLFTDRDRDGTADAVQIFADGIDDGMNLAFSPAGELYVVAAREVWALHDRDGDGVSESRTRVLEMARPEQVYDHAGLLGITFSPDGNFLAAVAPRRYFCTACHVQQTEARPLVDNTYRDMLLLEPENGE